MGGGKTIRATKSTNINYNISDRKGPKMKGSLQEQKDKKKQGKMSITLTKQHQIC
jgi:hypothetical protein